MFVQPVVCLLQELAESTLTPISTRATCTPCPPAGEELTASDSQLSAADESGEDASRCAMEATSKYL